jgi:hypothetical protein
VKQLIFIFITVGSLFGASSAYGKPKKPKAQTQAQTQTQAQAQTQTQIQTPQLKASR